MSSAVPDTVLAAAAPAPAQRRSPWPYIVAGLVVIAIIAAITLAVMRSRTRGGGNNGGGSTAGGGDLAQGVVVASNGRRFNVLHDITRYNQTSLGHFRPVYQYTDQSVGRSPGHLADPRACLEACANDSTCVGFDVNRVGNDTIPANTCFLWFSANAPVALPFDIGLDWRSGTAA
jgi:hypothetical protein